MQERRFSRISFDNSRYEQLAVVRNSIFGEILLCLDTQTQEEVIIKTIDLSLAYKKQSKTNEAVYENVIKEIDVMSQLSSLGGHRNVIKMRSYFVEQQGTHLYIVLDYCEGGDLLEHCIHGSTDMPVRQLGEKDVLMYLSDVLHGLHFLHINGIAHRDLSLENILIHQGRAVISDFGLCAQRNANEMSMRCNDIVGKHYYMAPEIVSQNFYDPMKADIWSLGVAVFILLTSSPPFEIATEKDQGFRFVRKHGIKAVFIAWQMQDTISTNTQDLIERMLTFDPNERISLEQILIHPALTTPSV